MELSKRLQAVANLVSDGLVVADIGTDHGYIPIYLVKNGKCPSALAMDVNEGPILRAKEHVISYGLEDKIQTRLSNGVKALSVGEAECVVVAGMGGALMIRIMEEGDEIFRNLKEFVLQPQSELEKVRLYLNEQGYKVIEEDMVLDEGKFYPMMKVTNGEALAYNIMELRYGKGLLKEKHPVLKLFLEKEIQTKELILYNLKAETSEHIRIRRKELEEEIRYAKEALHVYS